MISRKLIRIKAIQALYSHVMNGDNSVAISYKNLNYSLDKCYELYHLMLTLPSELASYSRAVIETARSKRLATDEDINPNMRFVENPIIEYLDQSDAINDFVSKKGLGWQNNSDLIKTLYNNLISRDYFKEYMSKEKCSFGDHKNLIASIFKNEIEDFDFLYEDVEDMSIFWATDIEYAASRAMNTVSQLSQAQISEGKELVIQPMYRDDSDYDFARTLFVKAAGEKDDLLSYIDSFTDNWEVERIALMDRLIMLVALTEVKYFDDIPVNVTFNEYIEIAKYYSTLKSKTFINGVLDKIVDDMRSKGLLSPLKAE